MPEFPSWYLHKPEGTGYAWCTPPPKYERFVGRVLHMLPPEPGHINDLSVDGVMTGNNTCLLNCQCPCDHRLVRSEKHNIALIIHETWLPTTMNDPDFGLGPKAIDGLVEEQLIKAGFLSPTY